LATGFVVFATLVDDPASVSEIVDAYLGEIMLEAASAADTLSASIPLTYDAAVAEAVTAVDVLSASSAVAGTTWNPADKESHITLSGGNLVATGTAGWQSNVRTVKSQTGGKYYWECTCTTIAAIQSGVGVAIGGTTLTSGIGSSSPTGMCGLNQAGSVFRGNTAILAGLGTVTSGTVICIALDITSNLIWFRYGATGNWNNNATYDPAAGIGGVAPFGAASTCYAMAGFGGADTITANFGTSAFTGVAPSGFTQGWPS
jgi:hypothetical protein